jgi:hypothetical protein
MGSQAAAWPPIVKQPSHSRTAFLDLNHFHMGDRKDLRKTILHLAQ